MTHHTDTERAEFEAWYIAGARKSVPAFAEWSEIELREGCMRPDSGSYRIDYARIAWDAWQAARRAPAVLKLGSEAIAEICERFTALMCDKRRLHISRGMDAGAEYYIRDVANYVAHAVNNAAAPQPPEANSAEFDGIKKEAAPVQLPEYDIDTANHAGIRVRGYTQETVRQLLAAHGIKEQST